MSITIGRSSSCDIIVPDDKVSRVHARIHRSGSNYVYESLGRNGSVIGGRVYSCGKVVVAPGTEILMAGRIPVPWGRIYTLMPLSGANVYGGETHAGGGGVIQPPPPVPVIRDKSIGIGWGILAFILPVAGWIMYFVWRDEYPRKASQAATIAWISFGLRVFSFLFYL